VFTARYAMSPYIKQTGFVFKGLIISALYVTSICNKPLPPFLFTCSLSCPLSSRRRRRHHHHHHHHPSASLSLFSLSFFRFISHFHVIILTVQCSVAHDCLCMAWKRHCVTQQVKFDPVDAVSVTVIYGDHRHATDAAVITCEPIAVAEWVVAIHRAHCIKQNLHTFLTVSKF
jgi:hypothetical protein